MSDSKPLILVTGGTGYVSLHTIKQGLENGYRIRTTCRSESRKSLITSSLLSSGLSSDLVSSIDIRIADFLSDQGWKESLENVDIILHTATPFPLAGREITALSEEEMIEPSLEGTRRILNLLKDGENHQVKKLIFLSSISCVYLGNPFPQGKTFTEKDWTDLDGKKPTIPFVKAKTLTEKLIWEFDQEQKSKNGGSGGEKLIEISTVLPTGILGEFLRYPNENNTGSIIKQMLEGALPSLLDLTFGVIDVRDLVSLIYFIAQRSPSPSPSTTSDQNRYIATSGQTLTLSEISKLLKDELPTEQTSKIPTRVAPSFLVKGLAKLNPSLKAIVPELGEKKEFDGSKAKKEFPEWNPRSREEAILSCARQLIENGAEV